MTRKVSRSLLGVIIVVVTLLFLPNVLSCVAPQNNDIFVVNKTSVLCKNTYLNLTIQLNNNSIELNCNQSILDGFDPSEGWTGITINSGKENTTVKNCIVQNYENGYETGHADWTNPDYVINNTFINNTIGVYAYFNYHVQITNNTFISNTYSARVSNTKYINVTDNKFFNNPNGGVYFSSIAIVDGSRIVDNYFTNDVSNPSAQIRISSQTDGLLIKNNIINYSLSPAIGINGGSVVTDVLVEDNIARNINGSGFILYGLRNSTIQNNVISDVFYDGIHVNYNFAENIIIRGNDISDGRETTSSGIYLTNNFQYGTITSNTVRNFSYPLRIYGGKPSFNSIYNNIFITNNFASMNGNVTNHFNISETSGSNIMGGPTLGGNYWGNMDGDGFSDMCLDDDSNGFCDGEIYNASSIEDHLPLSATVFLSMLSTSVRNMTSSDFNILGSETWVGAGPAGSFFAGGRNMTEINISTTSQTGHWVGLWGSVGLNRTLEDASGDVFYTWGVDVAGEGSKIFIANYSVEFNCNQTKAIDKNVSFSQSVYGWADSSGIDNLTETYNTANGHQTFSINNCAGSISDSAAVNLMDGAFNVTMIWDKDRDLPLFVSLVNPGATAYNGESADFEILLPVRTDGGIESYYLYGELL